MRTLVDLNADAGESFGRWRLGDDARLIPLVTSVNIACGWHAGDPATMTRSVELARDGDTAIGAHPGLPDLSGFGRRAMALSPTEAAQACLYQFGALQAIAAHLGQEIAHVKPHGALYGLTIKDESAAEAVVEAFASAAPGVRVVLLAGPVSERLAQRGFPVVREAFADLDYDDSGHIIIEPDPQAKPPEACADQAEAVLRGEVRSVDGKPVPVDADTICVHGDRPNAVDIAEAIRARFASAGVRLAPMTEVADARG
ncbi:LamB/YcsF family protein [Saccharopolyspora rhizosphaerae]|uniref:LamB/YcsF family protein n=1 Tax=Saccharopolyspora rhizosphaerae TaxID=2492662 RepID=A0A3R8Q052_9PSEU|nr:5-oxoprolinase subunit PxpA [Saccharopolyspora rhizosphaerae]RRO14127.1 LamB/YcsF family protein [Saccharopolyspora rhizosphaerae]